MYNFINYGLQKKDNNLYIPQTNLKSNNFKLASIGLSKRKCMSLIIQGNKNCQSCGGK